MSKQTFDLETTFRSRKAGREETVGFFDLPLESQHAIIHYGAQRFINDKLGGADLGQEEAAEKFDEILAQLRKGWIDRRGTGGGGASVDPIQRKMAELARDRIRAALKAKGIKMKDVPKEKMAELIAGMVEKDANEGGKLRAQAEQIVAMESQSLDLGNVDLDSLDL